jgi:putative ABC transport system permease protein
MSALTLILRSVSYHWRTNVAVSLGISAAVAALAGALVVGDSVRGSLREIALGRLGRTTDVISSAGFFHESLAERTRAAGVDAAPLVVATALVTHEPSGRRAADVLVYGVDERFWRFHRREPREGVLVSPALAAELSLGNGDVLLTRLQKPSAIPLESLFAQKEDVGRTVRLTATAVLPRDELGEFALEPQQAEVRAVFAPLRRVQRDLDVRERVNTVLVAAPDPAAAERAFDSAVRLDDLGVRVEIHSELRMLSVESPSGILSQPVESAARKAGESLGLTPMPVFTYLANTIRKGDRSIPYSLVTGLNISALMPAEPRSPEPRAPSPEPRTSSAEAIVLNDWAAREIAAKPGDRIELDYYLWDAAAGLRTATAAFTVGAVVPMSNLAADRRLAPEYPGITSAESLAAWDPPFPLDLSRIRPQDERYWNDFRTTPKAFIPYERARDLWSTRYGGATSVRFRAPEGADLGTLASSLRASLRQGLSPAASGVTVAAVRSDAIEASAGATNFGEYFTYFSFFLVVSALLLAVLFFRLGIEGRLRQIGILRAAGYPVRFVRRLLVAEAAVLALIGSAIGAVGALAYAHVIVYGLTTWWVGAVGTTLLDVHVNTGSLAAGAGLGVIAALASVVLSLRAVARRSPRSLLGAQSLDVSLTVDPRRAVRGRRLAVALAATGGVLLMAGFASERAQAAAFFGAGAVLLGACLTWLSSWLRARETRAIAGQGAWAVSRLGFRGAAFRPSRSVLSAALIAAAAFIIVSVDAFRRGGGEITSDPKSGTGGFALLARSEVPIVHDPDAAAGREALLIQAPELDRARFTRFRLRPGDDASCLNLYRPRNPTIVAPEPEFIEANRFSFVSALARTDDERANPWRLLRRPVDDGTVPVIADATSLQYVLHARVGDTMAIDIGADRPVILRFVAALRDSVLQAELVMAEEHFVRLFPAEQGYRFFLVEAPAGSAEEASSLARLVERELEPFGVDAVSTAARLDAFHRVENTYLSTFQALGGLGLLLGTVGLATVMFRNVLERRRELALLRAVGFNARSVSIMIAAETALLLGAGIGAGGVCAAIAIAPAWLGRGGAAPGAGLALLLGGIVAAGLLSTWLATRAALGGEVLQALRAE